MNVEYSPPLRPFSLPPEIEDLRELARSIVERECIPLEAKFLSNQWHNEPGNGSLVDGSLPSEDWAHLRKVSEDAGLYTMGLPEELGGNSLGALGQVVIDEQLARSVVRLPKNQAPLILLQGTKEQQEEFFIPAATGKISIAFAQSEPGAGSDPGNSMRTTATRYGDVWRINGEKMWISGVEDADYLLVLAITDPEKRQHGGMTMFIVDRNSEGISTQSIQTWLTRRGHQHHVWFDNVIVPHDRILSEEGQGFGLGQQWLMIQDRLTRGSLAAGRLSRGLEIATDWAKSRVTFGAPLSERQAIQWMLVDVFIDLKAIRSITYETAARADAGEDVRAFASMAKLLGGNWGHRSMDKLMQIMGGMGETLEMPFTTWLRELRHGRVGGGTDEIQRMIIARQLLKHGKKLWDA